MDLYRFVVTNPDSKKVRFVPYNMNPDRIVDHKQILNVFKRFGLWIRFVD